MLLNTNSMSKILHQLTQKKNQKPPPTTKTSDQRKISHLPQITFFVIIALFIFIFLELLLLVYILYYI